MLWCSRCCLRRVPCPSRHAKGSPYADGIDLSLISQDGQGRATRCGAPCRPKAKPSHRGHRRSTTRGAPPRSRSRWAATALASFAAVVPTDTELAGIDVFACVDVVDDGVAVTPSASRPLAHRRGSGVDHRVEHRPDAATSPAKRAASFAVTPGIRGLRQRPRRTEVRGGRASGAFDDLERAMRGRPEAGSAAAQPRPQPRTAPHTKPGRPGRTARPWPERHHPGHSRALAKTRRWPELEDDRDHRTRSRPRHRPQNHVEHHGVVRDRNMASATDNAPRSVLGHHAAHRRARSDTCPCRGSPALPPAMRLGRLARHHARGSRRATVEHKTPGRESHGVGDLDHDTPVDAIDAARQRHGRPARAPTRSRSDWSGAGTAVGQGPHQGSSTGRSLACTVVTRSTSQQYCHSRL